MNLGQTSVSTSMLTSQDGQQYLIDKFNFVFKPWAKQVRFDTYGGKQVLDFENEPLFAELVVLRLLEKQGYKGVWVDTYRNKFWQHLPHFSSPVLPDKELLDVYEKIYRIKGGRKSGCFDIIAFNGDRFVFAELKKKKEDKIRPSQIDWLKAAKVAGLNNPIFFIAEWGI